MNDYIFFMHNDAKKNIGVDSDVAWERYFAMLRASGQFAGGSSIGSGISVTKTGQSKQITSHLSGYIRIQAESIEDATKLFDAEMR